MPFVMTSRRCMPASRASSVGVRWIAIRSPPAVACSVRHVLSNRVDGANLFLAICGFPQADLVVSDRPADLFGGPFTRTDSSVHVAGPVVRGLCSRPVDAADW